MITDEIIRLPVAYNLCSTVFGKYSSVRQYQVQKMNSIVVSICACVLTCCVVTSSPVYPSVPLKHFSPTDACLFICNICFDDMGPEMMECANNLCLVKEQFETNLGLIKLGRTCKNFSKLEDFVFGNETD
ncbi:uncharacterized protein LOC123545351 [Mercenaria mercenaria]|uniref:uncharacterized protein LOC123545351 n=1 Tax=Mercenaria mercenaria TaxID=6596 RepID=UPI00234EBB80|nr:uncharacterized protein LOC123545351 [Mercenaria mercenaria]